MLQSSFIIFKLLLSRLITVWYSLFPVLVDIQEYYELTLLDDHTTDQQRAAESIQVASKLSGRQSVIGKQPVVAVRPANDVSIQ